MQALSALLQAQYYDGSKGEFLSEDSVFLGDPKQQVEVDPGADPQIGLEKIAQQLEEEGVVAKTAKKRHARRYAPNFCTGYTLRDRCRDNPLACTRRVALDHLPSHCQSVLQFRIGLSKLTPSAANSAPRAIIGAKVAIWFASATVSQKLTLCIALFERSMPT